MLLLLLHVFAHVTRALQSAVMKGVVASTDRREKASKGRSYQEFLIDSAAPNSAGSSAMDKDSSIGARRAKFSGIAKELTLERSTVCVDDPASFTQRAMVRACFGYISAALPMVSVCAAAARSSRTAGCHVRKSDPQCRQKTRRTSKNLQSP